jgi:hypothetical protein
MDFTHLLRTLGAARGRDAWVAITSGTGETAHAAVIHGSLGVPEEDGDGEAAPKAFLPVKIGGDPELSESIGVSLDSAEFEGAEGSLPGNLFVRLRDFNVRVATQY